MTERDQRETRERKGLIIVHTGDGKGKTTAALGMLLRAWGHGMRPCVIQFIKSRKGRWGEIKAAERLGIEWHRLGDGFVRRHGMARHGMAGHGVARSSDPTEAMDRARETWELAQGKIASGDYDLIILDEFTYPLKEGWVDTERVVAWLGEHKPSGLHLVITGRHAPAELLALADLVTEMGKLKHPYDRGIGAQAGIEF